MSPAQTTSEQELIDRVRKGSVGAFEQLVLRDQDRLYRFLLARTDNRSDADDALQEAFVAAFRHLSSYRSRYQFSTWLFTIASPELGKLSKRHAGQEVLHDSFVCENPGPEQLASLESEIALPEQALRKELERLKSDLARFDFRS